MESLNNHLKRHQLGETSTGDAEIDSLIPLAAHDVRAYLMENSTKRSLVDEESGLVETYLADILAV